MSRSSHTAQDTPDEKMLRAMEDPIEREVLLDLLKHRFSGHKLVCQERLIECASHAAFDALLDFEFTVGQEAEFLRDH